MKSLYQVMQSFPWLNIIYGVFLLITGFITGKILSLSACSLLKKRLSIHSSMLLQKFIFYVVFSLFIITAAQELGLHLGALLGAAGILTAAIGFASQTSISNLISGLFILGEHPFEIGSVIKVNDVQGEVAAFGWLSVQIRTNDNTMIRIPNETLIKSSIINLSYYPARRADLLFSLPYKEDINKIKSLLFDNIKNNPLCLSEPKPQLEIKKFSESAIEFQLSVWAKQSDFNAMKNSLQENVLTLFEDHFARLTKQAIFVTDSKTKWS